MFAFHYTFAAGPPTWKDLPCFIQKALRNFVTESEVVYDRNFFLKKFGIIVKNPILPYKTVEFKNNIISLKLVDEKETRLRHFQQRRRSFLKKYLPLYRSLREEIQCQIIKTEIRAPVISDERLIALSSVLGPTFVTRPRYYDFKKRDVPAFMSYHSQTLLAVDRSLQNGLWKISKTDRRELSMRILELWYLGRMTFPKELQENTNNYAITKASIDTAIEKAKQYQPKLSVYLKIPHIGIYHNVRSQAWRNNYTKIFRLNSVTREIVNTKEQIRENVCLRRQITAHPVLSELMPLTAHLKTRYVEKKVDLRALANSMFGIAPEYVEPKEPPLNNNIRVQYDDYFNTAQKTLDFGTTTITQICKHGL
jgi:hypothetical protein